MTWAVRHEGTMRRLGNRFQRRHDFIWRRPHTLQSEGKAPAALAAKVAALAGVSSLVLYAGVGLSLEGEIFSGHVLTIAAVDYTLSADAEAVGVTADGQVTVFFAPVLATGVSIDDPVTLPGTVDVTNRLDGETLWGVRSDLRLDRSEPGAFGMRGFQWSIPKNQAPLIPRPGHRIKIASQDLEGVVELILNESGPKWVMAVEAA